MFIEVAVATPSVGVVRVGDVANTNPPVPVSPVTAAAKFVDDGVAKKVATLVPNPDTPDEIGNPVAFVSTPEAGVPRAGVVRVGEVKVLFVKVSVEDTVTTFTPSTAILPADTLAIVVSVACPSSIEPTPNAVAVDATNPLIGNPVAFVRVPDEGVPSTGVVRVGEVRVLFVNV